MEGQTQDCLNAFEGRLLQGDLACPFRGVSINSRTVSKGELFICVKGERFDGHDFLAEVIDKKAGGIILSDPEKLPGGPVQSGEKPFVIHAKMGMSSNKSIKLDGASARDRVIVFEIANH